MRWWFSLFASSLLATVNEPLRCEWFSGYRNDRIHWHLQDPGEGGTLLYSELYRDVEYWENGLTFKVIHRDLSFFLRGSYGAFGEGTLFQRPPGAPRIRHGTDGWVADASGYFGYAVNLTADRLYQVLLTPLIGYSAHFERLQPENMRLAWYGFFFGAGVSASPNNRLVLNVGYAYNLLRNRFHTAILNQSFHAVKANEGGNMGQSGWAQIDGILSPLWRIGVGGQLNYFSTSVVNAAVRENDLVTVSQKLKLRWMAFSASAQISREF
jgi:hypothetical protein